MQDFQPLLPVRTSGEDGVGVAAFANQVVSLLAERTAKAQAEPREELVAGLIAASLAGTPAAFAELLVDLKRARVSVAALADTYIPLAARRMGEAWHCDEMSWLEVSIGVSRMQALLREIGSAWVADHAAEAGLGTVLMIVPEAEQHTLGPMVATGQMRRFGVSVCVRIAPTSSELRSLMLARQFDGVMISVATKDRLEPVAKLVRLVKSVTSGPIPVVIGGAVLERIGDLASATGADLWTNDVAVALKFMGLNLDAGDMLKQA